MFTKFIQIKKYYFANTEQLSLLQKGNMAQFIRLSYNKRVLFYIMKYSAAGRYCRLQKK